MNQLPQTGGSYRRDDEGNLVLVEMAEVTETGSVPPAAAPETEETNETKTGAAAAKTTRRS
jgi:hypothetical protein